MTDKVEEQANETPSFKHALESKTVWVNIIAFVAFLVQRKYGFVVEESVQAQILGLINIGLRTITKDPVRWSK
jgi:hypothetical protein